MEAPPYQLIFDGLKRGTVIPFLGAGASLDERDPDENPWKPDQGALPTGSELSKKLAALANLKPAPPELATTAQYFEHQAGRPILEEKLNEYLGREVGIPRVHNFLAHLPGPLVIVTTNYDDLLERAFRGAGHKFDLVAYGHLRATHPDSVLYWEGGEPPARELPANKLVLDTTSDKKNFQRTVIFKFHGFVSREDGLDSSYVITEDDYSDFLSRMVGKSAIPPALMEKFNSHAFLFLGYGLADWNLRLLLNNISRGRTKQAKSWAIQHRIEPFERSIWEQRNVNLHELRLADFLDGLESPDDGC